MNHTKLADAYERQRALDPEHSFIVQAPAGSGKTELLIQRYLVLLSRVRSPESIIAITFTRKAAAEMRMRLLNALATAQHSNPSLEKNERRWTLAKKVLAQDKAMNWQLLTHPNRLRIQTIDSFCQTLTRQMPLLSTLGKNFAPLENPEFLYRLAAKELIMSLENPSHFQKPLLQIAKHLDNDFYHLETLLSELLASREQWLDYLANPPINRRNYLEKNLQNINQEYLDQLNRLMPPDLRQELTELLNFSLHQRGKNLISNHNTLAFWHAAHFLLLTQDNTFRKQVTQHQGFPSPSDKKNKEKKVYYTAIKQRAMTLLQHVENHVNLHQALIDLKNAPPLHYTDSQWEILDALIEVLPLLVAHLKLIFQQYKKVDYTEILLCAIAALGHETNPSELALNLDYQIEHLLVDEFQDTSIAQFQLIEKLTAAWQKGDGHSLFLVGDPMQSIYRFRKAEVGLFLQVRQAGIGNIPLEALRLSVNFRSNPAIIDWINHCFSQLLPSEENINRGAIAFSKATAFQQENTGKSIDTIWFNEPHSLDEANKVVEIIQKIKQQDPNASIAILVRARTHLLTLLPTLQSASIAYHAIEIESLAEKSAIQDLLALTRALLHLGDRIAWLALLRSPFCGLDLLDLHEITQFNREAKSTSIWHQLICFENMNLKEESKTRLRRIVPMLTYCLQEQTRLSLIPWIKKTWLALGGPTTLKSPEDINHVHTFLNHLEKKALTEGEALDLFQIEEELFKLTTETNRKLPNAVEIMTIHKAKGLEYDHVILPSLDRKGSSNKPKLLLYQERLSTKKIKNLLLAPIKASHETEDLLYNYLLREEKQKTRYELTRLLYVASTRAKKSLSLLGTLSSKEKIKPAHSDSLLHHLWPAMDGSPHEISFSPCTAYPEYDHAHTNTRVLKRLPADWQNPLFSTAKPLKQTPSHAFSYQYSNNFAALIGTVIHRLLYHISQEDLSVWDQINLEQADTRFIPLLSQVGILPSEMDNALSKVKKALKNSLQDPRGRWIVSQKHQQAASEVALTYSENGNLQNVIIDRTFIDANETRWIIDYKTTPYKGHDPTAFLTLARENHKTQLETYAAAFAHPSSKGNKNPIRLGLYFPLNSLWIEWEYSLCQVS